MDGELDLKMEKLDIGSYEVEEDSKLWADLHGKGQKQWEGVVSEVQHK